MPAFGDHAGDQFRRGDVEGGVEGGHRGGMVLAHLVPGPFLDAHILPAYRVWIKGG